MEVGEAEVIDRHIEVTLEERGRRAVRPVRPTGLRRILTAAAVVLGSAVVLTVFMIRPDGAPRWAAQRDPFPQAVADRPVVETAADIRGLPDSTSKLLGLRLDRDAVEALPRLKQLEDLVLAGFVVGEAEYHGYAIDDDALNQIAKLKRLRRLRLQVIDNLVSEQLQPLGSLPILESLELVRIDSLGDDYVDAVARLPAIRELTLDGTGPLSAKGVRTLATMSGLHSLRVRGAFDLKSEDYRRLTDLKRLEVLDLSAPVESWPGDNFAEVPEDDDDGPRQLFTVDDAVLRDVAKLENLRVLGLANRRGMTDAGLRHLAKLPLEELDLDSCVRITDAGLATLPASLRKLKLRGCHRAGAALPSQLEQLREVDLHELPAITDATVQRLVTLPGLRHLDLGACPSLTPACIESLAKAESLEFLSLQAQSWLDDEHVRELAALTNLRALDLGSFEHRYRIVSTQIEVAGPTRVTGAGIRHLARLTRLEQLDLSTATVDAAALRALSALPLRRLDLVWVELGYDDETPGLAAVRELWPQAKVRWYPSSR